MAKANITIRTSKNNSGTTMMTARENEARDRELVSEQIDSAAILALKRLKEAHDSASNFGRNSWEFAIELSQMGHAGVDNQILRMLVCRGWIVHRRELTSAAQGRRSFEDETELVFSDKSCFAITKDGYRVATRLEIQSKFVSLESKNPNQNQSSNSQTPTELGADSPTKHWSMHHREPSKMESSEKIQESVPENRRPIWDRQRRELRLGDIVVKRFKWPAENQERVLNAFEDAGWPDHIDDPLPVHPDICAKRRLHDTLKCLNRKQIRGMIKFRGDGTGRGVRLEINHDAD